MARLRFTNRVRVCCNVVLPVEYFSSNGQLCLNCLCQPRGQAHSLTSQLSIEASVRLLELRQDGGEEQTHRCRRRSTSPRLKRSKGRHSLFPPAKAQQKRQTAALSIKTRIETCKIMSSSRSIGDENGKNI